MDEKIPGVLLAEVATMGSTTAAARLTRPSGLDDGYRLLPWNRNAEPSA